MGYSAIELRGIEMKMDLTALPEFSGTGLAGSIKDLDALGLKISDLGASARMHEGDPKVRQAQLDEGRRFIDLAQKLKAPYIRVFGDKVPAGEQKRDVMARVIDGLRTSASTRRAAASWSCSRHTATTPIPRLSSS